MVQLWDPGEGLLWLMAGIPQSLGHSPLPVGERVKLHLRMCGIRLSANSFRPVCCYMPLLLGHAAKMVVDHWYIELQRIGCNLAIEQQQKSNPEADKLSESLLAHVCSEIKNLNYDLGNSWSPTGKLLGRLQRVMLSVFLPQIQKKNLYWLSLPL